MPEKQEPLHLVLCSGSRIASCLEKGSAAQVRAAHPLVGQQLGTGALHDHAAGLQNLGAVGHGKGHLCGLLHQQDGHALLVDVADDGKDLLHQQG